MIFCDFLGLLILNAPPPDPTTNPPPHTHHHPPSSLASMSKCPPGEKIWKNCFQLISYEFYENWINGKLTKMITSCSIFEMCIYICLFIYHIYIYVRVHIYIYTYIHIKSPLRRPLAAKIIFCLSKSLSFRNYGGCKTWLLFVLSCAYGLGTYLIV